MLRCHIRPRCQVEKALKRRDEIKAIARLATPVVGTQLANMAPHVTDIVMAGHLSALDLAAVAVGNSIANPITISMMGILLALTLLM